MFNLKISKPLSKELYKPDFDRYFPQRKEVANSVDKIVEIHFPREHSYFSLQNSYYSVRFNVTHAANATTPYADGDQIRSAHL